MHRNIPRWTGTLGTGCAGLLLLTASLNAQGPCPSRTDSIVEAGWQAYRADSLVEAIGAFSLVQHLCPQYLDARVGLGFARLRQGHVRQADSLFGDVLQRDSTNSDAWEGRARARLRLEDTAAALAAGRRAVGLAPGNRELRTLLDRVSPDWSRAAPPPPRRPVALQLVARTRGRQFQTRFGEGWRPLYLKGVNLGVALPGRFPYQSPTDSAMYAGWLDTLAGMNANTLRVYTILPPPFYRALRAWNLSHPQRTLWLLHGVWAELPPEHDFNSPGWKGDFQAELRRVVDVIHGATPRMGHAAGRYDADVSRWVIGYIIGREWEPFAVKAFDAKQPPGTFTGRYLRVRRGPAMDLWLAQQCDLMLSYEADTYNALRPIAYTTWPTLDPLSHPTEASTREEAYWRRQSGRSVEATQLEYENDAIGVDPNLVEVTPDNPAGWFASYHVYPYYPDFMILDPEYRKARSSEGASSYFGYLRELIGHHGGLPTVIAEYGVPSSRGVAHLHPQGWSHGGHDERSMAAIDARLTREIRQAGAAGAILFAWLDEWFKRNWAVKDYEIPPDHTRLWHNVMDPEQHYGIMGLYAGRGAATPQLGGLTANWRALTEVQRARGDSPHGPWVLRAGADESYYYLAVELNPGTFPWDSIGIQLAIDTYQPRIGQHRLPGSQVSSELGFEFLIDLVSPGNGAIRVIPDYNRYDVRLDSATGDDLGRFSKRPVTTRDRNDGRFDALHVITNRARFARDGAFFRAQVYDRGTLSYGTRATSSLADWYHDERAGLLQLRIPWDLLNVTDPSTRTLLHDENTHGAFGTITAKKFHVGVVLHRRGRRPGVVGALPEVVGGFWPAAGFQPWSWRGWSEPRWHARLKPVYDSLRLVWQEDPGEAPAPLGQRAP